MRNFREFDVWKVAHQLTKEVYIVTKEFPVDERFGMSQHLRKTTFSIPSNIAEGCGRESQKEFNHFLNIASGSTAELDYQLQLAYELEYILETDYEILSKKVTRVHKMLHSLMNTKPNAQSS